jgi:hypothetical protein
MPYKNLPKRLWGRMERCVASVKKKGDVDNAYAVCYKSVTSRDRKSARWLKNKLSEK